MGLMNARIHQDKDESGDDGDDDAGRGFLLVAPAAISSRLTRRGAEDPSQAAVMMCCVWCSSVVGRHDTPR